MHLLTLVSAYRGCSGTIAKSVRIGWCPTSNGCYDGRLLCRAVDVVATRDLEAGAELTLDYGRRPMRDMLRAYGFTPARAAVTDPSEVYEEMGEACEALVVQGSGRVNKDLHPLVLAKYGQTCLPRAGLVRWGDWSGVLPWPIFCHSPQRHW